VDADGKVIEVTWKEMGDSYYGIEFQPRLVTRGAVLFNERNHSVYRKPVSGKKENASC